MFGNEVIDYWNTNFDRLWSLTDEGSDYSELLDPLAKGFYLTVTRLKLTPNTLVPLNELLGNGLDFQALCLLVFLIFFKKGNTSIQMTESGVTYYLTT